jgi:hypothetical protein
MASIRFGGGIVDARGSIAGNTFSRNGNGAYLRARVAPVQPNSPAQTQARQLFGARSQAFAQLTEDQVKAWNDAATGTLGAYTNRLGEPSQYSGAQLFNKINGVRAAFGLDQLDDPPAVAATAPIELVDLGISYDAGGGNGVFTQDILINGSAVTTADFLVDVAVVQSAAIDSANTPSYRRAAAVVDASGSDTTIMNAVDSFIPTPDRVPGTVIWLRLTPANSALGQTAGVLTYKLITGTNP